eukprot:TRINITY_DN4697_c0_g1_i3.p1 TRINITY_DN4697_c0_g1~~TRINITY_DN4697_c0_g1_i3.p1  ORF type:complete len:119 (-),score=20.61 TRINITY_DN4697_c0_g1_i3:61-417(-)
MITNAWGRVFPSAQKPGVLMCRNSHEFGQCFDGQVQSVDQYAQLAVAVPGRGDLVHWYSTEFFSLHDQHKGGDETAVQQQKTVFECLVCRKRFSGQSELRAHLKTRQHVDNETMLLER